MIDNIIIKNNDNKSKSLNKSFMNFPKTILIFPLLTYFDKLLMLHIIEFMFAN